MSEHSSYKEVCYSVELTLISCYCLQSAKCGDAEVSQCIFSFIVEVMDMAVKVWHETAKVDARVNFLLDKQKTQTDKYAPVVNIDKVQYCC